MFIIIRWLDQDSLLYYRLGDTWHDYLGSVLTNKRFNEEPTVCLIIVKVMNLLLTHLLIVSTTLKITKQNHTLTSAKVTISKTNLVIQNTVNIRLNGNRPSQTRIQLINHFHLEDLAHQRCNIPGVACYQHANKLGATYARLSVKRRETTSGWICMTLTGRKKSTNSLNLGEREVNTPARKVLFAKNIYICGINLQENIKSPLIF